MRIPGSDTIEITGGYLTAGPEIRILIYLICKISKTWHAKRRWNKYVRDQKSEIEYYAVWCSSFEHEFSFSIISYDKMMKKNSKKSNVHNCYQ